MRTTWKPGGIIDVIAVPKRRADPEARLFDRGRPWILVTTADGLEDRALWGAPPDPRPSWQWSSHGARLGEAPVAFICIEALREKPAAIWWEMQAWRNFYVQRAAVLAAGLVEGTISGAARYRLRDLAANLRLASDGSVLDGDGRHTGQRV